MIDVSGKANPHQIKHMQKHKDRGNHGKHSARHGNHAANKVKSQHVGGSQKNRKGHNNRNAHNNHKAHTNQNSHHNQNVHKNHKGSSNQNMGRYGSSVNGNYNQHEKKQGISDEKVGQRIIGDTIGQYLNRNNNLEHPRDEYLGQITNFGPIDGYLSQYVQQRPPNGILAPNAIYVPNYGYFAQSSNYNVPNRFFVQQVNYGPSNGYTGQNFNHGPPAGYLGQSMKYGPQYRYPGEVVNYGPHNVYQGQIINYGPHEGYPGQNNYYDPHKVYQGQNINYGPQHGYPGQNNDYGLIDGYSGQNINYGLRRNGYLGQYTNYGFLGGYLNHYAINDPHYGYSGRNTIDPVRNANYNPRGGYYDWNLPDGTRGRYMKRNESPGLESIHLEHYQKVNKGRHSEQNHNFGSSNKYEHGEKPYVLIETSSDNHEVISANKKNPDRLEYHGARIDKRNRRGEEKLHGPNNLRDTSDQNGNHESNYHKSSLEGNEGLRIDKRRMSSKRSKKGHKKRKHCVVGVVSSWEDGTVYAARLTQHMQWIQETIN